jgi:Swt1-like HEPN
MAEPAEAIFANLRDALLPWIDRRLSAVYGERWRDRVTAGRTRPAGELDVAVLLTLIHTEWSVVGAGVDKLVRSHVNELKEFRNRWAHQEPFTEGDRLRLLDTAGRLLVALGLGSLPQQNAVSIGGVSQQTPVAWPTLVFVACTATKLARRAKARDLYGPSILFQKCLNQVNSDGLPFVIVSSKYGIVLPDQELDPYSRDLADMSAGETDQLRKTMVEQLRPLVSQRSLKHASVLAGKNYQALIGPVLTQLGVTIAPHPRWSAIVDEVFPKR